MQAIWAKGYTELLDLVEKDSATSDMRTHIDCYGWGDDLHEVRLRLPCCGHTPPSSALGSAWPRPGPPPVAITA